MGTRKWCRIPSAAAFAVVAMAVGPVQGQQNLFWSMPENLGNLVNTPSGEQHPALSPDGLSLYFSTDRLGGTGGFDLWVSRRANEQSPWQAPKPMTSLNSGAAEFAPAFDPSGRWLFFGSERDGGCGGRDIWVSHRFDVTHDDSWAMPVSMGCGILSWPGFDDGPTYFREDTSAELFFISDRPGGIGARDVWRVFHSNGRFSAPVNVAEVNSVADDSRPAVRRDGLELFVTSQRNGGIVSGATPSSDIWVSRRGSARGSWSTPLNIAELNTSATEAAPTLSRDGRTMTFHSNRPGGQGGLDLWITTRAAAN
jgi:Tol biopolymer transport system component